MSLLKVKVTPKSESKLYNHNKVLKYTNLKVEITIFMFIILFMLLFI